MKKIIALALAAAISVPSAVLAKEAESASIPETFFANERNEEPLYEKGNFSNSFTEVEHRNNSRAWREGMVGGNGETGFVTSGSPYTDTIIYQHMYFNYPSSQPRVIPDYLTEQLEEARENVFNLNDAWKIWDYDSNGNKVTRSRTYFYSYHPGAQLRITSENTDKYSNYKRWTNYETAEVGVKYTDKYGEWKRTTFTSREDNVTITKIEKSSGGQLINDIISIDNISEMYKAKNGNSRVLDQRYKKLVGQNADYLALVSHYPVYTGSPLYDGGFGNVIKIIAEGENAEKEVISDNAGDSMLVDGNNSIRVKNAEALYLITVTDRTFDLTDLDETSSASQVMERFKAMESYPFIDKMAAQATAVAEKYTAGGKFDYNAALAPSAKKHSEEFDRLTFDLDGDEEYQTADNNTLIDLQRGTTDRINHEFMERAYMQSRYAQVCCGGTTAPRLYGMWTGEWNPGWRGIYTLDANVNLQVSAMNTGNLRDFQLGYITFFLRHSPDFMYNAEMAYGMHDAIQLSVNADADRAMHVEYDSYYPFEYWNAGASWCLLPIYEYWQCFGNTQIPINDYMRIDDLQKVLGVNDGGLTNEEFAALKAKGYLDLEKDILLPLLTKQANFWEQIVTPRYYTDVNGKARHDENKKSLNEGEKYIIIPAYSPENNPIGYTSTLTANATMDISAARDGLDMVCALEKAVGRDGADEAIVKWQNLKNKISDYKTDDDGALREWAMEEYTENNNHRHLSHLYVAWPAYDTQKDPELAKAANIALDNRNRFNTGDATAGHGWMHKALVESRLKRGDGMVGSLLKMMNGTAYYSSFMTDHDTNRRNDTYCTDTAFGSVAAVNEALAFSYTGEIEIIPALPTDWNGGTITGLMTRSRAELSSLSWNIEDKTADATITSNMDENKIKVRCGESWSSAAVNGKKAEVLSDEVGKYILVSLDNGESADINFSLLERKENVYEKVEISSSNAALAHDGNASTAASATSGEFVFDLGRTIDINKIVIKKQANVGGTTYNYWGDWVLAVGCELQGSTDGKNWKKIMTMNPAPDNKNDESEEVYIPYTPEVYRYIRYVRTEEKNSKSYGAWVFPDDNGNRLNLAEIEVYTDSLYKNTAQITISDNNVSAVFQTPVRDENGECEAYVALYTSDGALVKVEHKSVLADDAEKVEFSIDTTNVVYDNVKAFLWDKNMKPLGLETTIKKEEKPVVTPPPTEAPSDGNYTWKFDSFNEFSSSPVQNAPYKTGDSVYSTANKNIQLSNGGLAVDFDPAYTDEKVTIEFDMYMGSLKDKSTSYTIDSADGNILTVFVNEYSTSSSYISVEGAQILGGETWPFINKVNNDGMGAKATHFKNVIDLANGIATVTISNGTSSREVTGKFEADKIVKFAATSNHAQRYTYLDNLTVSHEASEALEKELSEYADELALPSEIYGNQYMPEKYDDVDITWSVSNEQVMTTDGVVTRGSDDADIKVKAIFTRGEEKFEKEYNCKVKAHPENQEDMSAYLFVHFVGSESTADEEQIYFSVSKDGQTWETINGSKPILRSDVGERGVRDPHIIRSPEGDKFFLIATDLSIYNRRADSNRWGTCQVSGSKGIVIWESTDLVNWSPARRVKVAVDNAGCTWAPESVYNEKTGEYMVFWASKVSSDGFKYQRIYRSYTRDFKHFSEPEAYIDNATAEDIAAGKASTNIDTTILENNGIYYRFTKNEAKSSVIMEQSTDLDGVFEAVGTYTIDGKAGNSVTGYEGPTAYKINGENKWCLLLDYYSKNQGYKPFITDDISKGIFTAGTNFSFDGKYRHGTVIPITQSEYDRLIDYAPDSITVKLNPEEESPFNDGVFEGWGTSMGWWGNRIGYSDKLAQDSAELFYSEDGLGLDIVRYNVGGGDDPTHNHVTRSDSKLPCFAEPQYNEDGTFKTDENGCYMYDYNWNADKNQTNVLQKIKEQNANVHIEGYTNSPPWFMTNSKCSGGGVGGAENLDPSRYAEFAVFLADVTEHYDEIGLKFDSYSPMNEPNPARKYWLAMNAKQEGNHVAQGVHQSQLILALDNEYNKRNIDTMIVGPDETSLVDSKTAYEALTTEAKAALGRFDTHTYSDRSSENFAALKQTAVNSGKNFWMSEVDNGNLAGTNAKNMGAGLSLAVNILEDMNSMQPSAWVMWDILDKHKDAEFVAPNGTNSEANTSNAQHIGTWGVGMVNHDTKEIELTQKYYVYGQFTKYINPGDTIIASSPTTLAAYNKDTGAIKIVAVNTTGDTQNYRFDLSAFSQTGTSAKIIRTSGSFTDGEHWKDVGTAEVKDGKFRFDLPANSVTTFVID